MGSDASHLLRNQSFVNLSFVTPMGNDVDKKISVLTGSVKSEEDRSSYIIRINLILDMLSFWKENLNEKKRQPKFGCLF